jgi:acyl-CoA thioesterase
MMVQATIATRRIDDMLMLSVRDNIQTTVWAFSKPAFRGNSSSTPRFVWIRPKPAHHTARAMRCALTPSSDTTTLDLAHISSNGGVNGLQV